MLVSTCIANIIVHIHTHTRTQYYDRIVVAGDVRANVVPNSTQVFRFDKEYGLTQDEVCLQFKFSYIIMMS